MDTPTLETMTRSALKDSQPILSPPGVFLVYPDGRVLVSHPLEAAGAQRQTSA